jgi:hypothetical protein
VWFNNLPRAAYPLQYYQTPTLAMIVSLIRESACVCAAIIVSGAYVLIEAIRAPEGYENERGFFFGVELFAPS